MIGVNDKVYELKFKSRNNDDLLTQQEQQAFYFATRDRVLDENAGNDVFIKPAKMLTRRVFNDRDMVDKGE